MYQIDNSTAVTTEPTRGAVGVKPNSFFQDSPTGGTILPADFMNAVMKELSFVCTEEGLTLDKADDTQIHEAIGLYIDRKIAVHATQYSGATVFSGALPTSWTDLDLSSEVGTNRCMVFLSVETDVDANVRFRVNGETKDIGAISDSTGYGGGASAARINPGSIAYMSIMTDASGVIEQRSSSAGTTNTIKLLTYQVVQ
jgi:hypothetical protein